MYICHSGGCPGSDMAWENEGLKYDVKTIAYSFYGHTQYGKNRKILEREELDEAFEHVKIASKGIGRNPNARWPYVKSLISRNWFQVKNAEAIFAIGKFLNKKLVSGGTGWAVQMGIDNKKPVFFFDQEGNSWNKYNYDKEEFEMINYIPKLTENFAGIGTRELTDNGKLAIETIFKENLEIKCHKCGRILNKLTHTRDLIDPDKRVCCECVGWGKSPSENSPTSSYNFKIPTATINNPPNT